MDETPEEMEEIRREADKIDVYRYRKRFRLLGAIGLGALMAGPGRLVWTMVDSRRSQPLRAGQDHFCKQDPARLKCKSYLGILDESRTTTAPRCAQHQGAVPLEDRTPQGRDGVDVK
jgi:hypothetical protein